MMTKLVCLILLLVAAPLAAETITYRVLFAGEDVGYMTVDEHGNQLAIDFDFKQNGRGPTMAEEITLDDNGFPVDWTITGTTTFGSSVDEFFRVEDGIARWQDATGTGAAAVDDMRFYIRQEGSVYPAGLLAQVLLADEDRRIDVFPAGEAAIVERDTMTFDGADGKRDVAAYEILGLSYNPQLVILDQDGRFFATASPRFSLVREGYEGADEALRDYAEKLSTERFVEIQSEVAYNYDAPVRIRNVRVFDPENLALTEPKDVLVYGNRVDARSHRAGQRAAQCRGRRHVGARHRQRERGTRRPRQSHQRRHHRRPANHPVVLYRGRERVLGSHGRDCGHAG
jgi:hypothetical protein